MKERKTWRETNSLWLWIMNKTAIMARANSVAILGLPLPSPWPLREGGGGDVKKCKGQIIICARLFFYLEIAPAGATGFDVNFKGVFTNCAFYVFLVMLKKKLCCFCTTCSKLSVSIGMAGVQLLYLWNLDQMLGQIFQLRGVGGGGLILQKKCVPILNTH